MFLQLRFHDFSVSMSQPPQDFLLASTKNGLVVSTIFFIFIPIFGEDEPILTNILFQMGWLKPPTRINISMASLGCEKTGSLGRPIFPRNFPQFPWLFEVGNVSEALSEESSWAVQEYGYQWFWSNYSDLTRPMSPETWHSCSWNRNVPQ